MTSLQNPPSAHYEVDFYAWLQSQARALRERRVDELDWENLAEEIESLARSERRDIEARMARLIEQLLKLRYASAAIGNSRARVWRLAAKGTRLDIERLLDESPSLRSQLGEIVANAYRFACLEALLKARLPDDAVPESCPFTVEQVMDDKFLQGLRRNDMREIRPPASARSDMQPKIGEWVWHHAPDPNFSTLPALVVATDGAPPSRSANTVGLMFNKGKVYWLSRDRVSPCSCEQAIKARDEARQTDPKCATVEEIEEHARVWQQQRANH
jgi:Domain of unknown function DUF29